MTRTLPFAMLLFLTGCARLDTAVTAYVAPQANLPRRYTLQGPDPSLPGGDPRWPRLAGMVVKALELQGFTRDEGRPEFILQVSYGSGDLHFHHHRTQSKSPSGHGTTTSTTTYATVNHSVRVEALEAASVASGAPKVLWSTVGEMKGGTTDLAECFPYLLASMERHFGTTAETKVMEMRRPWDAEVERLRKP